MFVFSVAEAVIAIRPTVQQHRVGGLRQAIPGIMAIAVIAVLGMFAEEVIHLVIGILLVQHHTLDEFHRNRRHPHQRVIAHLPGRRTLQRDLGRHHIFYRF